MNIENFTAKLIKNIDMPELTITERKPSKEQCNMLEVSTSDNSQFLIKIETHKQKNPPMELQMDETDSKLHEIYENFTATWEYNETLCNLDFDIDFLLDILDVKEYRRLEEYLRYYCSRKDELLFRLGFKYAWALFSECAKPI